MDTARYSFVERNGCPVCGSAGETIYRCAFSEGAVGEVIRTHYSIDPAVLSAAPYELVKCSACTLIYQRYVGSNELLSDLYGGWINEFNLPEAEYHNQVERPLASRDGHEILSAARFLGKSPRDLRTLDFGMGWAMWARISKSLGCDSFGTELSEPRVEFARAHGIKTPTDEKFDFINTEQTMEHITDLETVVGQLVSSLKSGGILKISVPSGERVADIVQDLKAGKCTGTVEAMMPVHPLEHVNSFNQRALATLVDRHGLRMVRPSLADRYSFLGKWGSISARHPKQSIKELIRPLYANPANLYVWLQSA